MDDSTSSRKRKRPSYLTEDYNEDVSDDKANVPQKNVRNFTNFKIFT